MTSRALPLLAFGFTLLTSSLFAAALPATAQEFSGPVYVIDGDTLAMGDSRIRLEGIDAPETDQACEHARGTVACGKAATLFLRDMIGDQPVSCRASSTDRYGRAIATCFLNGTNLNALMVRSGWAMAYRRYSSAYIQEEEAARQDVRGIWSTRFIAPWDWRRQ